MQTFKQLKLNHHERVPLDRHHQWRSPDWPSESRGVSSPLQQEQYTRLLQATRLQSTCSTFKDQNPQLFIGRNTDKSIWIWLGQNKFRSKILIIKLCQTRTCILPSSTLMCNYLRSFVFEHCNIRFQYLRWLYIPVFVSSPLTGIHDDVSDHFVVWVAITVK